MHRSLPATTPRIQHAIMACFPTNIVKPRCLRNTFHSLLAALLMLVHTGCDFGNYSQKVTDNYGLSAIDSKSNMALFYIHNSLWVGVVEKQVVAYVAEESFIAVIRRHSSNGDGVEEDYYFIPLTKPLISDIGEKNVTGPLSLEDVTNLAKERGTTTPLTFKTL